MTIYTWNPRRNRKLFHPPRRYQNSGHTLSSQALAAISSRRNFKRRFGRYRRVFSHTKGTRNYRARTIELRRRRRSLRRHTIQRRKSRRFRFFVRTFALRGVRQRRFPYLLFSSPRHPRFVSVNSYSHFQPTTVEIIHFRRFCLVYNCHLPSSRLSPFSHIS